MSPSPRPRSGSVVLAALGLLALTACQDKRLRELDVGISRDSAIRILADGSLGTADTIPNIYRHNRYFMQGREFDVYLFDAENRKAWTDPEVLDKDLTPVVVVDGKVDGWGWGHMDDVTSKYGIRIRAGDVVPTTTVTTPAQLPGDSGAKVVPDSGATSR
ncbi:MAG: hypothetical protein IT361_14975 [Gemmatimonadaceae bacterium]|nr:hypothetical protein [Gemmatimonadaceae bacterium]